MKSCASALRVVSGAAFGAILTVTLVAQTSTPQPPKKRPAAAPAAPKAAKPAPEPAAKAADVKIHTKYVANAQVTENTSYFKGARQRFEYPGLVIITQCDAKRTIELSEKTKRFFVHPMQASQPEPQPAEAPAASGGHPAHAAGGVLTYTTTLVDTGERKDLFGREARHIKSTTVKEATGNACDKRAAKVETDAWYVDLPDGLVECEHAPAEAPPPADKASQASCTDRVESKQVGEAKLGFAVLSTVTTTDDKDVTSTSTEVDSLQITSLAASLFTVPAGYSEVKSQADVLAAGDKESSLTDALFGSVADGTRKVAPKKTGAIRIGVVDPTNKSGAEFSAETMRTALVGGMNKVPVEAVSIQGSSPDALEQDAQAKACDYILTSDLVELKSSKPNKVSGILKKASGDPSADLVHDARIEFKLFALADSQKPFLASSAKASSGAGFGVGSALRLATTAGSLYMSVMPMMMMGPLMGGGGFGMAGAGMGGGAGLSRLMMGPSMGAAMSVLSPATRGGGGAGAQPASDAALQRTLLEACDKVGRAVMDRVRGH